MNDSVDQQLQLHLYNWRCFTDSKFILPSQSFVILDENGSGKTSLLSALYTLHCGQPWPETRLSDNLRLGTTYFGLLTQYNNWSYTAQIGPSGRLQNKPIRPETMPNGVVWPKIITYIPTDNQWLFQTRSSRLSTLNTLLGTVFGSAYQSTLRGLDQHVKSKQQLIRHCQEHDTQPDWALLSTYNQSIVDYSLILWDFRSRFFKELSDSLSEYSTWIQSPVRDWHVKYEIINPTGREEIFSDELSKSWGATILESLQKLWQREVTSGKVLFGAQRDEFTIVSNHLSVTQVLSRGEMRLLVLFIKNIGKKYIQTLNFAHSNNLKQPIWWFLDDVFNELDVQRENRLFQEVLADTDRFIASSTKSFIDTTGIAHTQNVCMADLTIHPEVL